MRVDMTLREIGNMWPFSSYGLPNTPSMTGSPLTDLSMEEVMFALRQTPDNPTSGNQVKIVNRYESIQQQCRVYQTSPHACQKEIVSFYYT